MAWATVTEQVERLVGLGVPGAEELRGWAAARQCGDGLVVVHPDHVPSSSLAGLMRLDGRPGFVVPDMTDLDDFAPVESVEVPGGPAYVVHDPDRGDEMAGWSPDEAMPAILAQGRSPMTVSEGICWLLQEPGVLRRNRCFMTIGSRKPAARGSGLDKRTPAIWISNGGERDGGRERRGAPKVGWCWAGNRHTWLGFGSVAGREA